MARSLPALPRGFGVAASVYPLLSWNTHLFDLSVACHAVNKWLRSCCNAPRHIIIAAHETAHLEPDAIVRAPQIKQPTLCCLIAVRSSSRLWNFQSWLNTIHPSAPTFANHSSSGVVCVNLNLFP